jgi:high-affinity nickel-transport protein
LPVFLIVFIAINILFLAPELFNYALIALGLGLRHGLDADHIIAIDNITRKLVAEQKPASSTGLFFALGHSTIVFCLTVIVVMGISHSQVLYSTLREIGDKIGGVVSIIFLIFTLILNLTLLKSLYGVSVTKISPPGFIYRIINQYLFKIVDRPAKMFIIGFLFGLGFDTATEIGLLSLTATSLVYGFDQVFILLLPILFAGGMAITDTVNSSFMANLYMRINQTDHKLKLYNYLLLSFASLATMLVIAIEGFNYLNKSTSISYFVMRILNQLGDNSDIVGTVIAGIFIILGLLIYKNTVKSFERVRKAKS